MQIIKERQQMVAEYFTHEFIWRHDKNAGFTFTVNADGKLLNDNPAAIENYKACISGEYDVIDCGIRKRIDKWMEPAVGLCECCGKEVVLSEFTNTCDCGTDYNLYGQMLAPRSQWGEETGEHWTECY